MKAILEKFMKQALLNAKEAWGETSPDPMVGAVIVEVGQVVAEGYLAKSGAVPAEKDVMNKIGRIPAPGSSLFITMEPRASEENEANLEQIIKMGFERVVIGTAHPSSEHTGKGIEYLTRAGVKVSSGILDEECRNLNFIYNYACEHKRPLIAAKVATTIDGKVATRAGHSKWITSDIARADVMHWRKFFPAIAVGATTVLLDDPKLTVRIEGEDEIAPIRFIFDGKLSSVEMPLRGIFTDEFREKTVILALDNADIEKFKILEDNGIQCWKFDSKSNLIPFPEFCEKCLENGLSGVLFEGGANLVSKLMVLKAIDYLFVYRAPKIFGDTEALSVFSGRECLELKEAITLRDVQHTILGDDQLMRGYVKNP